MSSNSHNDIRVELAWRDFSNSHAAKNLQAIPTLEIFNL